MAGSRQKRQVEVSLRKDVENDKDRQRTAELQVNGKVKRCWKTAEGQVLEMRKIKRRTGEGHMEDSLREGVGNDGDMMNSSITVEAMWRTVDSWTIGERQRKNRTRSEAAREGPGGDLFTLLSQEVQKDDHDFNHWGFRKTLFSSMSLSQSYFSVPHLYEELCKVVLRKAGTPLQSQWLQRSTWHHN